LLLSPSNHLLLEMASTNPPEVIDISDDDEEEQTQLRQNEDDLEIERGKRLKLSAVELDLLKQSLDQLKAWGEFREQRETQWNSDYRFPLKPRSLSLLKEYDAEKDCFQDLFFSTDVLLGPRFDFYDNASTEADMLYSQRGKAVFEELKKTSK